jgi:hypothetical protein
MRPWLARFAVVVVVVASAACTTDEKGDSCGLLDAYSNDDGEVYCPDEGAAADCEDVKDALVDSIVACGFLDEDSADDAAEDAFDCDDAVATTTDFDDCLDTLEQGECIESTDDLPDDCKGAVLLGS